MLPIRWLLSWAAAVLVTAVGGSLIQSQYNLARLGTIHESVTLGQRLTLTGQDLIGFAPNYAVLVALALLVAFLVAGLLSRWLPQYRHLLYPLAGFAAIAAMLGLMSAMLPVTAISAARSMTGFVLMCLPGALGGWLHCRGFQRQKGRT
ncbi:MAG: hypothetical protein ACXIUL_02065 [Wenzhouxiangella sp.]